MGAMGMDAAIREKPHQMGPAARAFKAVDEVLQFRQMGKLIMGDGLVDARQILQNTTTSTDIHMTDFWVTRLSFGQANRLTRGL